MLSSLSPRARRRWLLLSLLLLGTFALSARLGGRNVVPLRQPLEQFPNQIAGWSLVDRPALSADVLAVLKADNYMVRDYSNAQGAQAQLFVAYYRSQRAGEAMHSPKNCLPGSGWEPIQNDLVPLAAAGPTVMVNRYVVENEGDRALVLYWYQAQSHLLASEYAVKAYTVWDAMREGRRDGAIVRVLVPMTRNESVEDATQLALSLANPSVPALARFLPR